MTDNVKLLFFSGSTRSGSLNGKLARCAMTAARSKCFSANLLDLADYPMPLYNGDLEKDEGVPENAIKLHGVIKTYPGIFISGPEYNASITPLLKNTLDWLSRVKDESDPPVSLFKSRAFAIGAASPGQIGGMRSLIALRQILTLGLGAMVLPEQIAINGAGSAFDEDGMLKEDRMRTMLDSQIARLEDTARRLYA